MKLNTNEITLDSTLAEVIKALPTRNLAALTFCFQTGQDLAEVKTRMPIVLAILKELEQRGPEELERGTRWLVRIQQAALSNGVAYAP